MDKNRISTLLARAGELRCLVVGDLIVDRYLWGAAGRISAEAPVPVVSLEREELRPGGAANVAAGIAALGARVALCGVCGDDQAGAALAGLLSGVDTGGIVSEAGRPTTVKSRLVAGHQQVARYDHETTAPLSAASEAALCAWLEQQQFDLLVLSDYAKGCVTAGLARRAIELAAGVPVLVDPKGGDFSRYRGAALITPNRREAEIASGIAISGDESLAAAARLLMDQSGVTRILITRSDEGMSLFSSCEPDCHIAAASRDVYDVSGAGDTVVAALAVGIAGGLDWRDAAQLANHAAGVAVGHLGTVAVGAAELLAALPAAWTPSGKLRTRHELAKIVATEKGRGRRVVFTNGCFDLLHAGHVTYLQQARAAGDLLVVGVNSDRSVRGLKGDRRPIVAEQERAMMLGALSCVDHVTIFDEETPEALIALLLPDLLVKGGDYEPAAIAGKEAVEAAGGRVEVFGLVEGASTTALIDRIVQNHGS